VSTTEVRRDRAGRPIFYAADVDAEAERVTTVLLRAAVQIVKCRDSLKKREVRAWRRELYAECQCAVLELESLAHDIAEPARVRGAKWPNSEGVV
jgi:hypothetical protein